MELDIAPPIVDAVLATAQTKAQLLLRLKPFIKVVNHISNRYSDHRNQIPLVKKFFLIIAPS
jgi:hypothetical protein